MNPISVSTIAAITPSSRNFQPIVRNGRSLGYHQMTKAKMSVEADVKVSISVEPVDDTTGNSSFSFATSIVIFRSILDELSNMDY